MKAHTGLLLAGVLLLSTATAACGKKDDPAATSSGSSGSPAIATAGLKEGDNAPDVTLVLQDGKIKKIWRDVSPKDHANEVLSAAQS